MGETVNCLCLLPHSFLLNDLYVRTRYRTVKKDYVMSPFKVIGMEKFLFLEIDFCKMILIEVKKKNSFKDIQFFIINSFT